MGLRAIDAVQRRSQYRLDKAENFIPYRIMLALAWYADDNGVVGIAGQPKDCPTIDTIAERASVHRNTVIKWIPLLREAGEITTEKYGAGRGTHVVYTLNLQVDPLTIGTNDYENGTSLQSDLVPLISHSDSELTEIRELLVHLRELLVVQQQLMVQIIGTNGTSLQSDLVLDPIDPKSKEEEAPPPPTTDEEIISRVTAVLERWYEVTGKRTRYKSEKREWFEAVNLLLRRLSWDEEETLRLLQEKRRAMLIDGKTPFSPAALVPYIMADLDGFQERAAGNGNGHLPNPGESAWTAVMEQLRAGQWTLPRDGPETRALNRAGGWAALRNTQERELDFFKRRFLDAYQAAH